MAAQDSQHEQGSASDEISPEEIILKRLPCPQPGNPATTIERPRIGLTATSFALQPRPGEEYPSWSRRSKTSPVQLLHMAADQGFDIAGWSVAAITVAQVRELGLDVVAKRTSEDPGHCEIVPGQRRFAASIWSKLAKRTRVMHQEPGGKD